MDRMFTRTDIDFDKLHGEIRECLARQKELLAKGVKPWFSYLQGQKSAWEKAQTLPGVVPHKERYELGYLSARMTVLCSILNYAKGKNHFTKLDKSFYKHPINFSDLDKDVQILHEKLFGEEWKQFIKVENLTIPEVRKPLELKVPPKSDEPGILARFVKSFFG